jgi:hypothetical protein
MTQQADIVPEAVRLALDLHRNTVMNGSEVDDLQIERVIMTLAEAGSAAEGGPVRADLSRALSYWTGQACRRKKLTKFADVRLKPFSTSATASYGEPLPIPPPPDGEAKAEVAARTTVDVPADLPVSAPAAAKGEPVQSSVVGNEQGDDALAIQQLRMANTAYLWRETKNSGVLFDTSALEWARKVAGANPQDMVLREFMKASDAAIHEKQQREQLAHKQNFLRAAIASLAVLLVAATLVGATFWQKSNTVEALNEGLEAEAETIRAEASETKERLRIAEAEISSLKAREATGRDQYLSDNGPVMISLEDPIIMATGRGEYISENGPVMISEEDPIMMEPADEWIEESDLDEPSIASGELDDPVPASEPRIEEQPFDTPSFADFLRQDLVFDPPTIAMAQVDYIDLPNAVLTLDRASGEALLGSAMLDRRDAEILPSSTLESLQVGTELTGYAIALIAPGEIARKEESLGLDVEIGATLQVGNYVPTNSYYDELAWETLTEYGQFGFSPTADRVMIYSGATYRSDGTAKELWKVLIAANGIRSGRDLVVEAYCLALPVPDESLGVEAYRLTLSELSLATGTAFDRRLLTADSPTGPTTSPCVPDAPVDLSQLAVEDIATGRAALDRTLARLASPSAAVKEPVARPAPEEVAAVIPLLAKVPHAVWESPDFAPQRSRARVTVANLQVSDTSLAADLAALKRSLGLDAGPVTVTVNFAGMTRARIDALRATLLPLGWNLPRAVRTEDATGQSVLRFATADSKVALDLLNDLAALGWNDIEAEPNDKLWSGRPEIWLSL